MNNLDENNVYWISDNECVSIHLSNKPTGEKFANGTLKDNIVNEGWYLFRGKVGKMIPIKPLSEGQDYRLVKLGDEQ